jgi:hypothetical protein
MERRICARESPPADRRPGDTPWWRQPPHRGGQIAQRAADDLFAAAVGVAVCGIEEVDAAFNGVLDKRAAALFRKRPGVVAAVRLAKGHAAEAESGNP